MKRAVKTSAVFVVMLFTIICYSTEISSLPKRGDAKKTMLTLNNVKQGQELFIKNDYGIILYKELIEKDGDYAKGFDLTELPDGHYFFELNKDFQIQILPFKVILNEVDFIKAEEKTIFKPVVRSKQNKIFVSKLSLFNPLEVEIYYEDENNAKGYSLIHSETIENEKIVNRIYSLSKKEKGNYKLVFKSEGRVFTEKVTL